MALAHAVVAPASPDDCLLALRRQVNLLASAGWWRDQRPATQHAGERGARKHCFALRLQACRGAESVGSVLQVLHVEQEVVGDDTAVLQAVLECDSERSELLAEEAGIMAQLNKVGRPGRPA
jgi:hypothetical protein